MHVAFAVVLYIALTTLTGILIEQNLYFIKRCFFQIQPQNEENIALSHRIFFLLFYIYPFHPLGHAVA
jgi:hypothetical protein